MVQLFFSSVLEETLKKNEFLRFNQIISTVIFRLNFLPHLIHPLNQIPRDLPPRVPLIPPRLLQYEYRLNRKVIILLKENSQPLIHPLNTLIREHPMVGQYQVNVQWLGQVRQIRPVFKQFLMFGDQKGPKEFGVISGLVDQF